MHPAPSIILFTTLSGAGFGGIFWLGLGVGLGGSPFLQCLLAGLMAAVGLVASTFHLGNPQRAWRAFSQWRSSWLSREGVLAVATLGLFGLYALTLLSGEATGWIGLLAAIGAAATVYATAMIYGQMQTVPRWRTSLTPVMFLSVAAAGGLLLTAAPDLIKIVLLVVAAGSCVGWTQRADRTGLSQGGTPETATGLTDLGQVRLLEAPHSSPNYLMREMVFRVGRKHAEKLRLIALAIGLAAPVLLLLISGSTIVAAIALLCHLAGVAVSRWLFFAEAEHVVSLYYNHR